MTHTRSLCCGGRRKCIHLSPRERSAEGRGLTALGTTRGKSYGRLSPAHPFSSRRLRHVPHPRRSGRPCRGRDGRTGREAPGTHGGTHRRRGCGPSSQTIPAPPQRPWPGRDHRRSPDRNGHGRSRQTRQATASDRDLEMIGDLIGRDTPIAIAIPRHDPVDRAHHLAGAQPSVAVQVKNAEDRAGPGPTSSRPVATGLPRSDGRPAQAALPGRSCRRHRGRSPPRDRQEATEER